MIILPYIFLLINLNFYTLEDSRILLGLKNGMKLRDSKSFSSLINSKNELRLNQFQGMNYYLLFNSSKSIYLKAYQYEGDINYSISLFEIGYTDNAESSLLDPLTYLITDVKTFFITSNNLKLGMSKDEIVSILGNNYKMNNNEISYIIQQTKYNMPEYFIRIKLKNNKIINIKFGFEYP